MAITSLFQTGLNYFRVGLIAWPVELQYGATASKADRYHVGPEQ